MNELGKFVIPSAEGDSAKKEQRGSVNNPYTIDEYEQLHDQNLWEGGYVENVGFLKTENETDNDISSGYYEDNDFANEEDMDDINYSTQKFPGTCVPKVMEYAAQLLGDEKATELKFLELYETVYHKIYPVQTGIPACDIPDFLSKAFDYNKVAMSQSAVKSALETHKPVIGILRKEHHAVLVKAIDGNRITCVNPGNAQDETHNLDDIYVGGIFKINRVIK